MTKFVSQPSAKLRGQRFTFLKFLININPFKINNVHLSLSIRGHMGQSGARASARWLALCSSPWLSSCWTHAGPHRPRWAAPWCRGSLSALQSLVTRLRTSKHMADFSILDSGWECLKDIAYAGNECSSDVTNQPMYIHKSKHTSFRCPRTRKHEMRSFYLSTSVIAFLSEFSWALEEWKHASISIPNLTLRESWWKNMTRAC